MAIIKTPTKLNAERVKEMAEETASNMKKIYSNKSGDEYKMAGDIRKSPHYSAMEKLVVGLKTLKKFPENEARDINQMFNALHRPIWGKMVKEYIVKPTERNTMYTVYFTTGYRILRGELTRIYASTEATEKGIVYKVDKFARKEFILRFIRYYNDRLDEIIESQIRTNPKTVQESVVSVATEVVDTVAAVFNFIGGIFKHATELNPISFISALLSRSYDKKVEKFEDVSALYQATVQAYEDYMRIPSEKRSEKIESKYVKNIEKYNIKMNDLKAKIDHFDQRAIDEVETTKPSTPKETKSDDKKEEKPKTSNSDDFDF